MLYGAVAGAAGTAVLDVTTYADMAIRNRPPSKLPQKVAGELARRAHIEHLDSNRETAFGALLGYTDGFGSGALFGAVRPAMRGVPWFWAGIGLGLLTLVISEGSATALKQTDPREWDASAWIADLVPRFVYGWVTALTFDALAKDEH